MEWRQERRRGEVGGLLQEGQEVQEVSRLQALGNSGNTPDISLTSEVTTLTETFYSQTDRSPHSDHCPASDSPSQRIFYVLQHCTAKPSFLGSCSAEEPRAFSLSLRNVEGHNKFNK